MRKILLSFLLVGTMTGNAQSIIFAEDWDLVGPGISGWTLYNLDNRIPVDASTPGGGALSALVTDAWNVLSLLEIQGATPGYVYPPAAVTAGMAGNIIASNSWYDPVGASNDWLVSPPITIPAGTTGMNLRWAAVSMGSATFLEDYQVYISPTGGDAVADFTVMLQDINNESSAGTARTIALANSYAGTTVRIAFRNDSNDQYVMFIDNIRIDGTLSNDEFLSSKFNMYPNPANNVVTISNAENIMVSDVTISDINGRTVSTNKVNSVAATQINVSELNAGIYFMNITSDAGKAVKKFIKN